MATWGIFKKDGVSATFEKLQEEQKQRTRDGYKVYSNSHNDPEHHTKHDSLDSAKAELAKHKGGALYHGKKLYNKKSGMFESVEQIDESDEYKVYSNSHNDPEHHTKHSTLDSAKAELAKHEGGALYHKNKLYNKKSGMFESVNEGWDDMLKSVKDKNATQPNGGSGKKQGTRYGGGKQKDDEAEKRKEKNESVEQVTEAKEGDVVTINKPGHPLHGLKGHVFHSGKDRATVELHDKPKDYAWQSTRNVQVKHDELKVHAKNESTKEDLDKMIAEVLSADQAAGKWIADFTKSDAPQFAGKSPEKRKQMALAAYYAAQKKESTDYESFLVLDEEKQGDIVKMDAKEIKHANMKDKQDEADVMEPHSEGEAAFLAKHVVNVTDDPTATKQDSGASKLSKAAEPKGQGAGKYDGKNKTGIKEDADTVDEACSEKAKGKKTFNSFKNQMK